MKFKSSNRSLLADTWMIENVATLFSLLSMFTIVLLLFLYDSKPIFEWHGASLNSFIAVFATLSKTLLLMVVSSCLGQWKYIYFSREKRKLIEFDVFDEASRGPQGGFQLLWHTRFQYEMRSHLGAR